MKKSDASDTRVFPRYPGLNRAGRGLPVQYILVGDRLAHEGLFAYVGSTVTDGDTTWWADIRDRQGNCLWDDGGYDSPDIAKDRVAHYFKNSLKGLNPRWPAIYSATNAAHWAAVKAGGGRAWCLTPAPVDPVAPTAPGKKPPVNLGKLMNNVHADAKAPTPAADYPHLNQDSRGPRVSHILVGRGLQAHGFAVYVGETLGMGRPAGASTWWYEIRRLGETLECGSRFGTLMDAQTSAVKHLKEEVRKSISFTPYAGVDNAVWAPAEHQNTMSYLSPIETAEHPQETPVEATPSPTVYPHLTRQSGDARVHFILVGKALQAKGFAAYVGAKGSTWWWELRGPANSVDRGELFSTDTFAADSVRSSLARKFAADDNPECVKAAQWVPAGDDDHPWFLQPLPDKKASAQDKPWSTVIDALKAKDHPRVDPEVLAALAHIKADLRVIDLALDAHEAAAASLFSDIPVASRVSTLLEFVTHVESHLKEKA